MKTASKEARRSDVRRQCGSHPQRPGRGLSSQGRPLPARARGRPRPSADQPSAATSPTAGRPTHQGGRDRAAEPAAHAVGHRLLAAEADPRAIPDLGQRLNLVRVYAPEPRGGEEAELKQECRGNIDCSPASIEPIGGLRGIVVVARK